MSFSLKIVDGDLDLSTTNLGTTSGLDKLTQDLSLWLREQYRVDRFHPDYGSTLESYVGDTISELARHEIEIETLRVVTNYQTIQVIALQKNPSKFSLDELLDTVISVSCSLDYDKVYVKVVFSTASGLSGVATGEVTV